ncbi:MAG: uncharacterized membrane protein YbhN (UPF0104 family) [Halieaceae bacterium]|jgi:uncharacterized membrane protein YbhN (UPF0104 family)
MFDGKKVVRGIGSALTVGGIIFVVYRLVDYGADIDPQKVDSVSWTILGFLSFAYCLASIFLVLAWREILASLDEQISFVTALKLYGISQIAKYLPGNVFHLGSRQALGMAEGLAGWKLGKSVFGEFALLIVAALFFFILILPKFGVTMPWQNAFLLFIVGVIVACLFVLRLVGVHFSKSLLYLVIFFALVGMVFYFVAMQMSDIYLFPVQLFVGAFVISWLAGFLTPGSPAGMGVRELILLMLLKGVMVEADLLIAILLARGVSVLGDIWLLIVARLSSIFCRRVSCE